VFDCLGGNTPPQRNSAWNKGRKCFHCRGAPNNLIRPCLKMIPCTHTGEFYVLRESQNIQRLFNWLCLLRGTNWILTNVSLIWRPGFILGTGHERIVVVKVTTGAGFSPSTLVFPCQYHSTNTQYSFSSACWPYQKDSGRSLGNFQKGILFWKSRGALDRKVDSLDFYTVDSGWSFWFILGAF